MEVSFINKFENIILPPYVIDEIDVYTFLDAISNPKQETLNKIKEARDYYAKNNIDEYEKVKKNLPCYTLNFGFNGYKTNKNIKGSTGLMYIDLDKKTDIDLSNEYIFASWRSLSNTGRGILIKFDGLNIDNFKENYIMAAKLLGIDADKNAAKATQYNIQSYDKELYINNNSKVIKAKSVTLNNIINKKNKDSTECYTNQTNKIRYSTINEYDFKGEDYIFFPDEKEEFYQVNTPFKITEGKRNQILYSMGCQYRGLNKFINYKELNIYLNSLNDINCEPKLNPSEIHQITKSIMSIKDIEPLFNTPRRILFNPDSDLLKKEKISISSKLNGARRSKITQDKIKDTIDNWEKEDGKISMIAIAKKMGISRATVHRQLSRMEEYLVKVKVKKTTQKSL